MRSSRWLFPALLLLLVPLPTGTAHASQYLGERCWRFTNPLEPTSSAVGTFGLTNEGDGHISLRGRFVQYEGGVPLGDIELANGNAERIDGTLVLMLSISSSETPTSGDFGLTVVQIRLDPATLDGTYRGFSVGVDDPSGLPFGPGLDEGTAEHLPGCVIP